MRRLLATVVIIAFAGGCATDMRSIVSNASWNRLKPRPPLASPDRVELHYIFLERESGEPLISEKIWADADEQAIPLEMKNLIEANGLRIGKLGSRLSPELLELLETSSVGGKGRRHSALSGRLVKVEMTKVRPHWNLFTKDAGRAPRGEKLLDAQGYLYLTPTVADGKKVVLSVVPEVEFGPPKSRRNPAPDLSGWQMRTERDKRAFSELKVELELGTGEYILIGGSPDRPSTVGHHYFHRQDSGKVMQKALLVRVVQPTRDELYTAGYDFDDFFLTPIRKARAIRRSPVQETVLASRRPR